MCKVFFFFSQFFSFSSSFSNNIYWSLQDIHWMGFTGSPVLWGQGQKSHHNVTTVNDNGCLSMGQPRHFGTESTGHDNNNNNKSFLYHIRRQIQHFPRAVLLCLIKNFITTFYLKISWVYEPICHIIMPTKHINLWVLVHNIISPGQLINGSMLLCFRMKVL